MIDWLWVGGNALWVVGLAVCLAAGSYRAHQASQDLEFAETESNTSNPQSEIQNPLSFRFGLVLVALGLCAAGGSRWESGLWAVVAAILLLLDLLRRHAD